MNRHRCRETVRVRHEKARPAPVASRIPPPDPTSPSWQRVTGFFLAPLVWLLIDLMGPE